MAQRRALTDYSFKIHLAANFLFQIQLFLSQAIFQVSNFAICLSVLNANGYLLGDLGQERDLARIEPILLPSRDGQNPEQAILAHQRDVTE